MPKSPEESMEGKSMSGAFGQHHSQHPAYEDADLEVRSKSELDEAKRAAGVSTSEKAHARFQRYEGVPRKEIWREIQLKLMDCSDDEVLKLQDQLSKERITTQVKFFEENLHLQSAFEELDKARQKLTEAELQLDDQRLQAYNAQRENEIAGIRSEAAFSEQLQRNLMPDMVDIPEEKRHERSQRFQKRRREEIEKDLIKETKDAK